MCFICMHCAVAPLALLQITDARNAELSHKRSVAMVNAVNTSVMNVGPFIVALLAFATYARTSATPLTASNAFTSITLFAILRLPLMIWPMLVSTLTSGWVSTNRLAGFLALPDMKDYRVFVAGAVAADATQKQEAG